jgi:hypothetical protein
MALFFVVMCLHIANEKFPLDNLPGQLRSQLAICNRQLAKATPVERSDCLRFVYASAKEMREHFLLH